MKSQEILNRVGGANGCDLVGVETYTPNDEHICAIIIHEDATQISEVIYKTDTENVTDASGYIATDLGIGTLITFKYPVTSVTLTAGSAMVYFI